MQGYGGALGQAPPVWPPRLHQPKEEEHSLARLAGLPTTAWPTTVEKPRTDSLLDSALAIDRAKKAHFNGILASLEDLGEDALYAGIVEAEKALANRSRSFEDADTTLRNEIGKLSMEINTMQMQVTQLRAEEASNRDDPERITPEFELESLKRRLAATRRGVQATSFFAEKMQRQQAELHAAQAEREALQTATQQRKAEWQNAIQELNATANCIETLKSKHEALVKDTKARTSGKKSKNLAVLELNENEKEFRKLMEEQQALLQEVQQSRNAQQLKKLLDEEKRDGGHDSTQLIEEIAELEESTDIIEQRSQEAVEALRTKLELIGGKEMELQRTKAQADEWLKSIWSTICQQKREQLLLHQRIKEEDLWTAHLQKRTDALVQELTNLEDDVKGAYDEWGEPMPEEEQIEQDMWQDLQVLRDRRRGAQHRLAWFLSQKKPLAKALANCRDEQRELQVELEPIRGLLNA